MREVISNQANQEIYKIGHKNPKINSHEWFFMLNIYVYISARWEMELFLVVGPFSGGFLGTSVKKIEIYFNFFISESEIYTK